MDETHVAQTAQTERPHPESREHVAAHPRPREYVQIGVVLAVVTALEVALYYVDLARVVLVPSLLALAVIKFGLVALWFMHLKFDSLLYRRLFLFGLVLALTVFSVAFFFAFGG